MDEEMQSKEALKSQLDKEFIKKYRCLYNRRYKPIFRAVISHYVDNVTDINEENLLERLKTQIDYTMTEWMKDSIQKEKDYFLLGIMIVNKKRAYNPNASVVTRIKSLTPVYTWLKSLGLHTDNEVMDYVYNQDEVFTYLTSLIDWNHLNMDELQIKLPEDALLFVSDYMTRMNITQSTPSQMEETFTRNNLESKIMRYRQMPEGRQKQEYFEALLKSYEPFLRKTISNYDMNEADREDVYQQACIGFMQVVLYQHFPVANLAATVKRTVCQSIKNYLQNQTKTIAIPSAIANAKLRLEEDIQYLTAELGRAPTYDEISEYVDIPLETVRNYLMQPETVSLESLGSDIPLDTTLETRYEEQEYIKKMKTLLQTQFSAETQKVLEEIIFEGKKLRKLGRELHVSATYLRQMKVETFKKLQQMIECQEARRLVNRDSASASTGSPNSQNLSPENRVYTYVKDNYNEETLFAINHLLCLQTNQYISKMLLQRVCNIKMYNFFNKVTNYHWLTQLVDQIKKQNRCFYKLISALDDKDFYRIFERKGISRDEVDSAFMTLSDEVKELAYSYYGEELSNPLNWRDYREETTYINRLIIQPIYVKALYFREFKKYPISNAIAEERLWKEAQQRIKFPSKATNSQNKTMKL